MKNAGEDVDEILRWALGVAGGGGGGGEGEGSCSLSPSSSSSGVGDGRSRSSRGRSAVDTSRALDVLRAKRVEANLALPASSPGGGGSASSSLTSSSSPRFAFGRRVEDDGRSPQLSDHIAAVHGGGFETSLRSRAAHVKTELVYKKADEEGSALVRNRKAFARETRRLTGGYSLVHHHRDHKEEKEVEKEEEEGRGEDDDDDQQNRQQNHRPQNSLQQNSSRGSSSPTNRSNGGITATTMTKRVANPPRRTRGASPASSVRSSRPPPPPSLKIKTADGNNGPPPVSASPRRNNAAPRNNIKIDHHRQKRWHKLRRITSSNLRETRLFRFLTTRERIMVENLPPHVIHQRLEESWSTIGVVSALLATTAFEAYAHPPQVADFHEHPLNEEREQFLLSAAAYKYRDMYGLCSYAAFGSFICTVLTCTLFYLMINSVPRAKSACWVDEFLLWLPIPYLLLALGLMFMFPQLVLLSHLQILYSETVWKSTCLSFVSFLVGPCVVIHFARGTAKICEGGSGGQHEADCDEELHDVDGFPAPRRGVTTESVCGPTHFMNAGFIR